MDPVEAPATEQDQPTTAPDAETPDQATPEPAGDSFYELDTSAIPEDTDPKEWAATRHKEMQQAFTRKTTELADQRREADQVLEFARALQNPETRDEALQLLGVQAPAPEEDAEGEYVDDSDRIASLEQKLEQRDEAEQERQMVEAEREWIAGKLEKIEEADGRELSDKEIDSLVAIATANRKEDGEPDFDHARELLSGVFDSRQKAYIESKRAPRVPGAGTAAERQVDLSDSEKRVAHMAQRLDAISQAEDA